MRGLLIIFLFFTLYESWGGGMVQINTSGSSLSQSYEGNCNEDFQGSFECALEGRERILKSAAEISQTINDFLSSELKIMKQEYDALKEELSSAKASIQDLHEQLKECNAQ